MKEHGDYTVGESGQVVLLSGRGPWNDETLKQGASDTSKIIVSVSKRGPWGQLSYLSGESLMPPSTFKTFIERTQERKNLGMQALAIVITDSDIVNTIKAQLTQAYLPLGVTHQFFNEIDDAITWLQGRNLTLSVSEVHEFFQKNAFHKQSTK
ncbi:hypothetical protein [Aliiglaciecola litoralis]|uniref:STAS/SEC14 domain-containing protein n=1 Tax=Aliiglaciecola litoralis TaxID=582857 RepID=A0ABP3WSE3_9ALTE